MTTGSCLLCTHPSGGCLALYSQHPGSYLFPVQPCEPCPDPSHPPALMASAPAWLGTRSEAAGAASVGGASRALGPAAGALAGRVQPERRHVSAPLQRKASEGSPLGSVTRTGHRPGARRRSQAPPCSPQARGPAGRHSQVKAQPYLYDPSCEVGQIGPWAKLVRSGGASPTACGSAAARPLGGAPHSLLPRGAWPAYCHRISPWLTDQD